MRVKKKYNIELTSSLKSQLLNWSQQFDEVLWLDSNHHTLEYSTFQAILAVDAYTSIKTDAFNAFEKLEDYQSNTKDWLFGYLTYDLKNDVENLGSSNYDGLHFPDLFFFQPKKVFLFSENKVEIQYLNVIADELESDWAVISNYPDIDILTGPTGKSHLKIRLRTSKDLYFEKVGMMQAHILQGDIYEANFCQEFYAENVQIDPVKTYMELNDISRPPFATFLKLDQHYALSASPERYMAKIGDTVISQPIKGTSRRNKQNEEEDLKLKEQLAINTKERSENIMITDLVRNDLSKFAEKGSVQVKELCQTYTFEQVHQLISTITCKVAPKISAVSILKNTFPMGSMTGAPKIAAMKIIEELEDTKRGLYSGAIGYFTPRGDFDFNVIIRSILFNKENNYLSFSVGGAITSLSIPESEYQECLLKAKAMREVLER